MPVNTRHTDYVDLEFAWSKCRHAVAGEDAVKAQGSSYLPMLGGQSADEYEAYKKRASFFAASGRTVDGLAGAIMGKDPDLEWPESDRDRLKNIGMGSESLEQLLAISIRETISPSRMGILVDRPPEEEGVEQVGAYVTIYFAEDIVNWREEIILGKRVVTMVVLAEQFQQVDPDDVYEVEMIPQFRCLFLGGRQAGNYKDGKRDVRVSDDDLSKGVYYQEVWREDKSVTTKNKYVLVDRIVPRKAGGRLFDHIPFTFVNHSDCDATPRQPALLDLINVNYSHYRTSADVEHGRHFTALPTPWFAGFDFVGTVAIGSGVAHVTKEPQATAGMLEFTGAGLGSLEKALAEKSAQMAALGSRMLEQQKASAEAAETLRLRGAGEKASLSTISKTLSEAWTKVLRWIYLWDSASDEGADKISIALNTEFGGAGMTGDEMSQMIAAVQAGLVSWDTWFYNLQRAGIMPQGVTSDEEREKIENEGLPAALGTLLTGPGAPGLPPGEEEEDDDVKKPQDEEDDEDEEEDPTAKKPKKKPRVRLDD